MKRRRVRSGALLAAGAAVSALFFAACASTPAPREEVARAQLAVEQAESSGAEEHAALEMRKAREKLQYARDAVDKGNNVAATKAAEQAAVDAQLAAVKTRRARAETRTEEAERTLQALEEEIQHDRR